ncbi:hypothetical protein [Actibacterium ureilyticum]|uniref:hypothetical protein n=1 Tax=Actibacterium ureilyticum TaxID=1590614 RepID=UPI000BAB23F0|nr:hypothetical protein [Actibacterium ureilyticum]
MERGHILITGTGRAGTTLLVRIFTRLGLDTGFTQEDIAEIEKREGKAGLEKNLKFAKKRKLPEIIKSPHATDNLRDCLEESWCKIDHCIIPIRELAIAARSRDLVQKRSNARPEESVPGGFWKATSLEGQEAVLARQLFNVIYPLAAYEIPTTFLAFPKFAKDPQHFMNALGPLLKQRFGKSEAEIMEAYRKEVRPDFITAERS